MPSTLANPAPELPAFNVRELVARLVKTGKSAAQAQEEAEAVRDAVTQYVEATLTATVTPRMTVSHLAVVPGDPKQASTRGDIYNLASDVILVHKDIEMLAQRTEDRFAQMDAKIEGVDARLNAKIDTSVDLLRREIGIARRDTIIWLGGILGTLSLAIGGLLLHLLSRLPV